MNAMNRAGGGSAGWIRPAAQAILLASLLFMPPLSVAASRAQAAQKPAVRVTDDFSALAAARPRKCADEKASASAARGWRVARLECAWQDRLQMRRWEPADAGLPKACLSRQALWWHSALPRYAAASAPHVWSHDWQAQSLEVEGGGQHRIAVVARDRDGDWSATEWTWLPSPRAATRKWQAQRWKLLQDAAREIRQASRLAPVAPEAALLKKTWEKNLRGRPAEVSGDNWFWEGDGFCLRMETAGLSKAQLQVPYSKEDGRLEQRAAMQLQLARTYPRATWLTKFRLLPLSGAAERGGAKFEAIWIEDGTVKGQLWIPTKTDGSIFRARVAAPLPARKSGEAELAAAIERELIGLATIWTLDHEH